jgi:hypothetical protein
LDVLAPSAVGGLVEEIERLASLVDRGISRPARWRGPIRREFQRTRGGPAERAAVAFAFDRWIPIASAGEPLSPGALVEMHRRIVGDGGGYRSRLVRVGPRQLPPETIPPPHDVPGLVEDALARNLAGAEPAPLAAARLHLELLLIHPFPDGNGRVARLAAGYALAAAGYRSTLLTAVEQHSRGEPEAYALAFGALRAGGFVDHDGWLEAALRAAVARVAFAGWWREAGEPDLTGSARWRRWRRRHPRNAQEMDRQVRRVCAEQAEALAMPA